MKVSKTLTTIALMALCGNAIAQTTYTDAAGDEYEFSKHLFLNVSGGAQYTLGEAPFGDLLSPNVQIGTGLQMKPWLAARVVVGAWQSKGGLNGVELSEGQYGNTTYKYKYIAPGVDVMFNLSNAVYGWNPERKLNVSAFIGAAANIGFGNDRANELNNAGYKMSYVWDGTRVRPVGRGGVELAYRLNEKVSITLEGNANVMLDHYNSKHGGNADWYFNGLAGIKINLGKTAKKKDKPAAPPVEVTVEPIAAPQPVVAGKPEEAKAQKPASIRHDVFFRINSYTIDGTELKKVEEIAKYMNANGNARIKITGYADAGTGNDRINDRISAQRAKAVADMLATKYGVGADRISCESKGARVQPFADNDRNRVSICIINE